VSLHPTKDRHAKSNVLASIFIIILNVFLVIRIGYLTLFRRTNSDLILSLLA
jgi:hypothetical protein